MSTRKKITVLICSMVLGGLTSSAFADNNVVDFPDHSLLFPGASWNNGGVDTVEGRNRADSIEGGDGVDYLYGEIGADYVAGDIGPDTIEGGPDDDCSCQGNNGGLYANGGDDFADGNSGNDRLEGGGGSDILNGGSENDNIYANDGEKDYVDGGPGSGDDCFVDNKDVYQSC